MQAKDIYDRYFDETKSQNGYQCNYEFMEDLYRALDVILLMTFELKADLGISLEMMRKRGLSVTFEEIQQYFYPQETCSMEQSQVMLEELLHLMRAHMTGRIAATESQIQLALLTLMKQENLSEWKVFCLLVGGACATDRKYERIFSYLQDNNQAVYATKGLLFMLYQLMGSATIQEYTELMSGSPFLEHYFVKNQGEWEQLSFLGMPVTTKNRVAAYLYGDNRMSGEVLVGASIYHAEEEPDKVLLYQREQLQLNSLILDGKHMGGVGIILQGEVGSGRKLLIQNLAFAGHKKVLFVEATFLEKEETQQGLLAAVSLELIMHNAYLCLCNCNLQKSRGQEEESKSDETNVLSGAVYYLMSLCRERKIPFFVTAQSSMARMMSEFSSKTGYGNESSPYSIIELVLGLPDTQEKIFLWKQFLAGYECAEDVDEVVLGNKYLLNAGEIHRILESAALYAASFKRIQVRKQDILYAMKQHNSNALGLFAERIEPMFTWDDLIVEPEVHKQLDYICSRLRLCNVVDYEWGFREKMPYGRGTCALFYGASGTGKTMAVQVLANTLDLELYRVDLSRMLSKYIGETQKHISELFERAKNINALLFFDEADAFFSKRTEVSNSNDRNANAEVAHLLQKLESYEGISVLATNLKDNIDDAFKRRIKYMVHFRLPDASARQLLWKKSIPQKAPVEADLALAYYAQHFELSGSEIKEAVIHAAYMAAQERSAIGNRHVIEALKLCFAKYGKLLTKDDFEYLL